MKAVIVNCFDTYEDRVDLVHEFFKKKGYDVIVIQSDFRHFKKKVRTKAKRDFVFVKSAPYYKNLSVKRLFSHYKYARDAFKIVRKIKPDLLYTFVPPNSLAKCASNYKRKHKEVKLILDLIDLWPETMPIGKAKKFPLFTSWGKIRDNSLKYTDLVITECDLYQTILVDSLKSRKVKTLYLAKKDIKVIRNPHLTENEINLAYLGSINHIIDIPKIKEVIEAIQKVKPVILHIIGDGESKQRLIDVAEGSGATVKYYGKIYDAQKKQDILDQCNFGLNIMKNSVCVGLTMKSIDFFQHGLPIINNIIADTQELVEKYGVGINIIDNLSNLTNQVMTASNSDTMNMRSNSLEVFSRKFSVASFNNNMSCYLKK